MPTVRDTPELQNYLRSMGVDPMTGKALQAAQDESAPAIDPNISEKEFQGIVTALATEEGWLWHHTYDSRRSAEGVLDLEFVRDRLVKAELKTTKGKLTPAQKRWLNAYRKAGVECYVWRPADIASITETLKRTP